MFVMNTKCQKRLRLLELVLLHGSGSRKAAGAARWFTETIQLAFEGSGKARKQNAENYDFPLDTHFVEFYGLNRFHYLRMLRLISALVAMTVAMPLCAVAGPSMNRRVAPTPYGALTCKQRATNKLYSIGATNVNPDGVWADVNGATVMIWCRRDEVIIVVAGPNNVEIANEIERVF